MTERVLILSFGFVGWTLFFFTFFPRPAADETAADRLDALIQVGADEQDQLCFVEVHNVGTSKVALVNPNELGPFDLEKSEYITIEPGAGIRLPVLVGEPTKMSKLPVACMGLLP